MKAHLRRMLRATAWADRSTLDALRACPAAHPEALPLLAHVLAAEHVWLCRLQGHPVRHAVWPTLSLDECASLAEENAAGFLAYLDGLAEEALAVPVPY